MEIEDKIKGIIEGASEVPDSFVWERISSSLNVRARRRLYFKRGAYSVASAAAVTLLLFINFEDGSQINNSIQVLTPNGITAVVTPNQDKVVSVVKRQKIKVIPTKSNNFEYSAYNTSSLVNQESAILIEDKNENISVQNSEQNNENKSTEVSKKVYRNSIADVIMPTAKKKISKISLGAYAYLNTSYQNSSTNMYAPGLDLDDSKTFMAPGTQFYVESDMKYYVPTQFGLQVQIPVDNRYSVSTGLTYSFLRSDVTTSASGGESYTVVTQLQYVGLPLSVNYNIVNTKNLRFYASLGGLVEKGINAKISVSGSGNGDSEFSSTIKPLALSLTAGMGIEYMFGKYLGLYADPGLTYFFDTNQPISIRTVEQLQFKCEVGLRLHL